MAKRRFNGEGSYMKQRSDGRYEWKLRRNGKTKSIYAKNQKKLREKVKIYLADLDNEVVFDYNKMLFSDYIAMHLVDFRRKAIKSTTYSLYMKINKNNFAGSVLDIPLEKLDENHLQKFFNEVSKHYSYESIKRFKGIISNTLTFAYKRKHKKINPIDLIELPSKAECNESNNKSIKFLSKNEFYDLYDIVLNTSTIDCRLKTLIILLQFSRLRIGEALGLQWSDIDFNRESISIERRIKREEVEHKATKTELVLAPPKTANSTRVIPLPEKVFKALKKMKKYQVTEKENSFGLYKNLNFVFATPIGTPVDSRNELRRFKNFLNLIKFRTDISFHTLRHSYASLLLENGTNVVIVSELLGHADVTITLKVYAHITSKDKIEAVKDL